MLTISPQAGNPLYRHLADRLREQIDRGDLRSHDRLASEAEFAREHGISHVTYRRALRVLEEAGYIYKVHGSGSYVSASRHNDHHVSELADRRYVVISFPENCEDSPQTTTVRAAVDWFYEHGHPVIRLGYLDVEDEHRHFIRNERIMSGVLSSPDTNPNREADNLGYLSERGVPVVLAGSVRGNPQFDQVSGDDRAGAEEVVRQFAANGHTRIAFISPHRELAPMSRRRLGYDLAMDELGLPPIVHYTGADRLQTQAARDLALSIFAADERPTAVLCCNDTTAYGVYHALRQLGISMPEDVELCGFDNTAGNSAYPSPHHIPQLSTVNVPRAEIGRKAAALLHRRLSGWNAPVQRVLLPAEVLHRGTTRT